MEDSFPIVVEPDVWCVNIVIDCEDGLVCAKCKHPFNTYEPFSVLHLLWLVKYHLKEFHNG